jgi:hypothetical protein
MLLAKLTGKKRATIAPEEAAERKRRSLYRWKVIFGLVGPFALQALDTTVIASAFGYIATDFRMFSSPSFARLVR